MILSRVNETISLLITHIKYLHDNYYLDPLLVYYGHVCVRQTAYINSQPITNPTSCVHFRSVCFVNLPLFPTT